MFYDVPCVLEVSEKYGMKYAIFSDPFEAMSYAARMGRAYGHKWPLQVLRREWSESIMCRTWIEDHRT